MDVAVKCPSCGHRGLSGHRGFEVRGRYDGYVVMRCPACGGGLLLTNPARAMVTKKAKCKAIDHAQWRRMCEQWERSFPSQPATPLATTPHLAPLGTPATESAGSERSRPHAEASEATAKVLSYGLGARATLAAVFRAFEALTGSDDGAEASAVAEVLTILNAFATAVPDDDELLGGMSAVLSRGSADGRPLDVDRLRALGGMVSLPLWPRAELHEVIDIPLGLKVAAVVDHTAIARGLRPSALAHYFKSVGPFISALMDCELLFDPGNALYSSIAMKLIDAPIACERLTAEATDEDSLFEALSSMDLFDLEDVAYEETLAFATLHAQDASAEELASLLSAAHRQELVSEAAPASRARDTEVASSVVDGLERLAELHRSGLLTAEEFAAAKEQLLSGP